MPSWAELFEYKGYGIDSDRPRPKVPMAGSKPSGALMLKVGVHPKIVSERLGHSTINITLDTYSRVLPDMQRDAALALDQVLAARP